MARTNSDRLRGNLLDMALHGATPAGGVTRLTLSDEDAQARHLFARWAEDAGLAVRVDDMGNQYARLEGQEPDAAPVLLGSHLDTVPAGGKFDGAFGVLAALEVARTLLESGARPRRAIEVVNFTNEEGIRFQPALMSSAVLAGKLPREFAYSRQDSEGKTFEQELKRIGFQGSSSNRPGAIHAYLEAHIEQGPILEQEGLALAAVDSIIGRHRYYVTLEGQSQHAGPSPMRTRRDAMVAAARIIVGVRDLALEYQDPVVTTVGHIRAVPGVVSQVPREVTISVDLRHPTSEGLAELILRAGELVRLVANEERVEYRTEVSSSVGPIFFDPSVVALVEDVIQELGQSKRRMISGAGQDAQFMSMIAPTAMLFVRTIGGKSHCESEAIDWDDAHLATEALLRATTRLAEANPS